ncbi:hypothetical protein IT401_01800 [Candidatus Nomurabacteria bacterium]|nr:hypothetical protein [Candidatus Nomurabacteria bacterium]
MSTVSFIIWILFVLIGAVLSIESGDLYKEKAHQFDIRRRKRYLRVIGIPLLFSGTLLAVHSQLFSIVLQILWYVILFFISRAFPSKKPSNR